MKSNIWHTNHIGNLVFFFGKSLLIINKGYTYFTLLRKNEMGYYETVFSKDLYAREPSEAIKICTKMAFI